MGEKKKMRPLRERLLERFNQRKMLIKVLGEDVETLAQIMATTDKELIAVLVQKLTEK